MPYIGQPLNAGNLSVDVFTGNASTTVFALTYSVGSSESVAIYLDGVKQAVSTYTASGTVLTFTTAPPNGVGIEVVFLALSISLPTPGDGSVTAAKIATGAVTSAKILDGAIVNADINASAAIALSKLASDPTTKVYSGALSRDSAAATGTVAYTGIGFQPKAIIAFSNVGNADQVSWGADDGTKGVCIFDNNYAVAGTYSNGGASSTSVSIFPRQDGSNWQGGYVTSWGADGFTIQWTKTGSPTGTITVQYIAIG